MQSISPVYSIGAPNMIYYVGRSFNNHMIYTQSQSYRHASLECILRDIETMNSKDIIYDWRLPSIDEMKRIIEIHKIFQLNGKGATDIISPKRGESPYFLTQDIGEGIYRSYGPYTGGSEIILPEFESDRKEHYRYWPIAIK